MKIKLWKEQETHMAGDKALPFDFSARGMMITLLPSYDSSLGYTVEEIRQRGKLLDLLENAGDEDEVEITKPMAELLLNRIKHFRANVPSINLVKLTELLEQCP